MSWGYADIAMTSRGRSRGEGEVVTHMIQDRCNLWILSNVALRQLAERCIGEEEPMHTKTET